MTITSDNLVFFKSERMTDNADGGGQMTAVRIVPSAENQIFDDISDVDRAAGDVSIRKVYAAVTSADTSKYLDAAAVIFRAPTDPTTSVMAFSSGSFYDEHSDIKGLIEQTISQGSRWNGYLWGQHSIGQMALVLWQYPTTQLPSVGDRMELVTATTSEYVWITQVTQSTQGITDNTGTYSINQVTLEIAEGLANNYIGTEPSRYNPTSTLSTTLYSTRYNPDAVPLHGIKALTASGSVGDYAVQVDSLYMPVIPTSFIETALPDDIPGSGQPVIVAGNSNTITFTTTTQCIKPNASLYLGNACYPGSLAITGNGAQITDQGGDVLLGGITTIGTINYATGVASFTDSCPNYSTYAKYVTFKPAAALNRIANTSAIAVSASNAGFVWVTTLTPIPCPGSLSVSYMNNNSWYVITDDGSGNLSGADSSYGSAKLNYATGTVTLTTGAIPDVGSQIIFSWGILINSFAHGGDAVVAPYISATAAHVGLTPGTVSVSWIYNAVTYTLTDEANPGELAGTGGTGTIQYSTGMWEVTPTHLPNLNTVFTLTYHYGEMITDTSTTDGTITLSHQNVLPGSVNINFSVTASVQNSVSQADTGESGSGSNSTQLNSVRTLYYNGTDDGNGAIAISSKNIPATLTDYAHTTLSGTIDYTNGLITLNAAINSTSSITLSLASTIAAQAPTYAGAGNVLACITAYVPGSNSSTSSSNTVTTVLNGGISIMYQQGSSDTLVTETTTPTNLAIDLTPDYAETVIPGSTRFTIGTDLFCDIAGKIYRNPATDSGVGTISGTLDPSTGSVLLSSWTPGVLNSVTLQSLATDLSNQPVAYVNFRTSLAPVKSGTLQLRYTQMNSVALSKTVDTTGNLVDTDCTISVNFQTGVVNAKFGKYLTDAECTTTDKTQFWYSTENFISVGGVQKIWKPIFVLASSIIYNAVAESFLPPNSALLGLNAARLPPDGKALAFNVGRLALVHNTQQITQATLSANQVIDCGRTRLYRVEITDAASKILTSDQYTLDRVLGTITMSPSLDQSGYTAPWSILHTVADLARVAKIDISGKLTLNQQLSHTYPDLTSYVSSVLYFGTLQAGIAKVFSQTTWTGVWQDSVIGTPPLCQYSDALFPILTTNCGAYPDKILIKFTSTTAFQVIGENLGLIGIGDITHNCMPINPLTSQPYFTIDYRGWGGDWAVGNCLRFNVNGACYPIDLIRAVQPSPPTNTSDSVALLLLGSVN